MEWSFDKQKSHEWQNASTHLSLHNLRRMFLRINILDCILDLCIVTQGNVCFNLLDPEDNPSSICKGFHESAQIWTKDDGNVHII